MSIAAWVNGQRVDDRPALLATDHGVTVGDGVFETCKAVDGRVFARRRHHDRMDRSLKGLGLPSIDREYLDGGIADVLAGAQGLMRLRYTVTGGNGPLGSDRLDGAMTYLVMAGSIEEPAPTTTVLPVEWTRNERSAVAGLKTTSYAENVVALAAAKEKGATEAIFGNNRGELCEGTGSNIFVVVDGEVLTPPLSSAPLAGITRELVIDAAAAAGVQVREQALPMSVLDTCDEAFLTSSTRDVQGITAIGSRQLPPERPLTQQLADAFAEHTAHEWDGGA